MDVFSEHQKRKRNGHGRAPKLNLERWDLWRTSAKGKKKGVKSGNDQEADDETEDEGETTRGMAYSMVKACKLEPCHMKAREAAKFPILLPGKSQSGEKLRVELRHLAFYTAISLECSW